MAATLCALGVGKSRSGRRSALGPNWVIKPTLAGEDGDDPPAVPSLAGPPRHQEAHPVPHGAYLVVETRQVLNCLSPESLYTTGADRPGRWRCRFSSCSGPTSCMRSV